jgi:hypothetical protein
MAKFQVWIVNLVNRNGEELWNDKGSYKFDAAFCQSFMLSLEKLFRDVCAFKVKGSRLATFDDADVSWHTSLKFMPGSADLVLRIIKAQDSITGTYSKDGSSTGSTDTTTGGEAISEVFADVVAGQPTPDVLLANVAFHEAMHNKLETGPGAPFKATPDSQTIHVRDGTGLAVGVDATNMPKVIPLNKTILSSTKLSDANKTNMAKNLQRVVPQFMGRKMP